MTAEQSALKSAFRQSVLRRWRTADKFWTVHEDVAAIMGWGPLPNRYWEIEGNVESKLREIPSIGYFLSTSDIRAWLASHFPKTSNAMFDGKTNDEALAIWRKEKRTTISRRPDKDYKEFARDRRKMKTTSFVRARSLSKKHDWNTVK